VGLELNTLPSHLWLALTEQLDHSPHPIDGWLAPLRAIKTPDEVAKLRQAFALTDLGHQTARTTTQIGASEIEVWTAVRAAIERAAGQPLNIGHDCIASSHAVNIGDYPTATILQVGDSLTVDLGANYRNYWSDSCMTYFVSDPTPQQTQAERAVQEALELAISLVKPGVKANFIDQQTRAHLEKHGYPVYPHHTGHGIGVSAHEAPRLAPYNEEVLQAGMVIMLEPGIYLPHQISIRHEHAVLVTHDGAEVLTQHDMRGWIG
jgi:Xaa-Pro aminopeptidase